MKNLALSLLLVAVSAVGYSQAVENVKPKKTPAQIRKELLEQKQRRLAESGGIVIQEPKGKVVQVINNQTAVPESEIKEAVDRIMKMTTLPIQIVKEKTSAAGTWVELVCNDSDPSILSAIDDGWAKVNLQKVVKDNPPPPKLKNRVMKYMWRAIGASFGAGISPFQPSIMRNVERIEELDQIPMMQPEPGMLNCFKEVPSFFGIENIRICSYKRACEEGWAPAPTNETQRAVMEKVMAEKEQKPSNPLRIKPGDKPAKSR